MPRRVRSCQLLRDLFVVLLLVCIVSHTSARCSTNCNCQDYSITCSGHNALSIADIITPNEPLTRKIVHFDAAPTIQLSADIIREISKWFDTNHYDLELMIDDCQVRYIENYAFASLSSYAVRDFFFRGNGIIQIKFEHLKGFEKLRLLDLSSNRINDIKPNAFSHFTSLRYLYLSNNSLSSLENNFLEHLSSLVTLDLSHNSLFSLSHSSFVNLRALRNVNISFNEIKIVDRTVFSASQHLTHIDLSHNAICTFYTQWLSYECTALSLLDLSHNQIEDLKIVSYQLFDPKRLSLNFQYNRIKRATVVILCNRQKQFDRTVNLANNRLQQLTLDAYSRSSGYIGYAANFSIDVSSNPSLTKVERICYNQPASECEDWKTNGTSPTAKVSIKVDINNTGLCPQRYLLWNKVVSMRFDGRTSTCDKSPASTSSAVARCTAEIVTLRAPEVAAEPETAAEPSSSSPVLLGSTLTLAAVLLLLLPVLLYMCYKRRRSEHQNCVNLADVDSTRARPSEDGYAEIVTTNTSTAQTDVSESGREHWPAPGPLGRTATQAQIPQIPITVVNPEPEGEGIYIHGLTRGT